MQKNRVTQQFYALLLLANYVENVGSKAIIKARFRNHIKYALVTEHEIKTDL